MITAPLNDRECLDKMTALAVEATKREDTRALAQRFGSPRSLAAWIRSLPQRDDDGSSTDWPRVTCDVSQRVRIGADDPNCVERSLLYIATSELLDAGATRALATIETPAGRHTFPVENGRPVVLDPNMRRNQLAAGLWLMDSSAQRNAGAPLDARPAELLAWLADIAEEPATDLDGGAGRARLARARRALSRLFEGAQLAADQVEDVVYMLDHASNASEMFGRAGRYGAQLAREALARLGVGARRNGCECPRNVKIAGYDVRPDWDKIEKGAYVGGKVVATYYGGPLAGSLWDPAFQAATGKSQKKAAPPTQGAASSTPPIPSSSSSSSSSTSSQSSTTSTTSEAQSLQLVQQFMTLSAFAQRR